MIALILASLIRKKSSAAGKYAGRVRPLPQAHQSTKAVRFGLARAPPEPQKDATSTCLAGHWHGHGANLAARPAPGMRPQWHTQAGLGCKRQQRQQAALARQVMACTMAARWRSRRCAERRPLSGTVTPGPCGPCHPGRGSSREAQASSKVGRSQQSEQLAADYFKCWPRLRGCSARYSQLA